MKLRHALTGLAAAVLISVPSASFAGQQYTPFDSGAITAGDAGEPSNPQIDLTRLQASRTDSTFKVVSTYTGVPNATRSRYYAAFYGGKGGAFDLFELVVKRDGTTKANHYIGNSPLKSMRQNLQELRQGISSVENVPCKGYSVSTNKNAKTLTFTIPASCVESGNSGIVYLISSAARWTDADWDGARPSNENAKPSNKSDGYGNLWIYGNLG